MTGTVANSQFAGANYTAANYAAALRALAESRPGFDWHTYAGSPEAYNADRYTCRVDLRDARALLAALDRIIDRGGIDAAEIHRTADGGRVEFYVDKGGELRACYQACQYEPTEFRAGVCRLAASLLWNYARDHYHAPGVTPTGDSVRAALRRLLGARLQRRWAR